MDILQKSKNSQRRIGLTGGIASGKTTITNYIKKHKNIPYWMQIIYQEN